jgi:hypothetical protein
VVCLGKTMKLWLPFPRIGLSWVCDPRNFVKVLFNLNMCRGKRHNDEPKFIAHNLKRPMTGGQLLGQKQKISLESR